VTSTKWVQIDLRYCFLSSSCGKSIYISLELYVINYSSEKHVKENTSPNCSVIFLPVNIIFSKIVYR
jgi:hypothetical protein